MNPIDFVKMHGRNPEEFRAQGVQDLNARPRPTMPRRRNEAPAKRRKCRRDISEVRRELYTEWFEYREQGMAGLFVAHLMLDVLQIIAGEYLSKAELRHKERHHYTLMMDDYHNFMNLFFQDVDKARHGEVVDMMDAFGEFIHNDLEIFRFNVAGCDMALKEEFRDIGGALCCCKLMACQAMMAWKSMLRGQDLRFDSQTIALAGVEHHCSELAAEFCKREVSLKNEVAPSVVDRVKRAEECVVNRIVEFVNTYRNNETDINTYDQEEGIIPTLDVIRERL